MEETSERVSLTMIQAAAAGAFAFEEVNQIQTGQVSGVTSAGVFIRPGESGCILFLSEGRRRGPLSINLGEGFPALGSVRQGDAVQLGGGSLVLPGVDLEVRVDAEQVWLPAPVHLRADLDLYGARLRLERVAAPLLAARPDRGLSWLLRAWLNGSSPPDQSADPLGIYARARHVQAGLAARDAQKTARAAARLLGYGPGLTPSGDDFVLGILLLLNRWLREAWIDERLGELNRKVCAMARQATTSISASLIECAAHGQADEGLVAAADYLAAGVGQAAIIVDGLLGWGSNSGVDTLAGMAVVSNLSYHPKA